MRKHAKTTKNIDDNRGVSNFSRKKLYLFLIDFYLFNKFADNFLSHSLCSIMKNKFLEQIITLFLRTVGEIERSTKCPLFRRVSFLHCRKFDREVGR